MIKQEWHAVSFGPSIRITEAIDRRFSLDLIVNEKRSFSQSLYNLAMLRKIEYREIETKKDLDHIATRCDIGICYGFGLIFSTATIQSFTHGIWNIHAGKLPHYRSRHPIGWALLENQRDLTVSIHAIDSQIDQGSLLAELTLPISVEDNEETLTEQVERTTASKLIDLGIIAYQAGTVEKISEGRYLSSLQGKWDYLDPAEVDSTFLFNLIRSKMRYGGIDVAGKKYTQCDFVYNKIKERYTDGDFYTCKDGIEVYLR